MTCNADLLDGRVEFSMSFMNLDVMQYANEDGLERKFLVLDSLRLSRTYVFDYPDTVHCSQSLGLDESLRSTHRVKDWCSSLKDTDAKHIECEELIR